MLRSGQIRSNGMDANSGTPPEATTITFVLEREHRRARGLRPNTDKAALAPLVDSLLAEIVSHCGF